MGELTFLSAVSMAEQIRRGELSPVELVEAHLARIEELNPRLNAFVQVDVERARREARIAEAAVRNGEKLGPLHGVPLSIKSSMQVAGLRWEAGTKLRAGTVAERDAPLVTRLRQAGAIILGVTNAPELLMAWETDNLLYGRTNNPWDLSADARRIEWRRSGGHCVRYVRRRCRQRRWRIDSRARALQRNLRIETHSRTDTCDWAFPRVGWSICPARRGRTDGPQCR